MPTYDRPLRDFPITDDKGAVLGRMMLPERIVDVINEVKPPINVSYSIGARGLTAFTLSFPPMVPKGEEIKPKNVKFVGCIRHEAFSIECHECFAKTVGGILGALTGTVNDERVFRAEREMVPTPKDPGPAGKATREAKRTVELSLDASDFLIRVDSMCSALAARSNFDASAKEELRALALEARERLNNGTNATSAGRDRATG